MVTTDDALRVDAVTNPFPHVAVIGGGFSGAMTAVNLARLADDPLHVTVIDPRETVGRGTAYAQRRPEFLLNVAARNMSAFPDEPDHFLQWLRTRSEYAAIPEVALRESFIPRQVYGDYLAAIVHHHLRSPGERAPVSATFVTGEAVDVDADGAVRLADGTTIAADCVVLATGNETPAGLPGAEDVAEHPAWVADPWRPWEDRLPADDGAVVILGTGLTAVDVIVTLRAVGWAGPIHAVSRHGWFPHGHFRGIEYPEFPPAGVDLGALGLDGLVALVNEHCTRLHERNAHPAIIVDKLRPYTQRLWRGFTREERLTFATEHAARWNVHRHRIAPEIHGQVTQAQLTGQLQVHAAAIDRVHAVDGRIVTQLAGGPSLEGDLVVNATGPSSRLTRTRSTLLRNLLHSGMIAPDDVDFGVRVAGDHTAVTATGDRSPALLVLGPLLKGTYWETVAVPELRGQARRVAETVLDRVHQDDEDRALALLEHML